MTERILRLNEQLFVELVTAEGIEVLGSGYKIGKKLVRINVANKDLKKVVRFLANKVSKLEHYLAPSGIQTAITFEPRLKQHRQISKKLNNIRIENAINRGRPNSVRISGGVKTCTAKGSKSEIRRLSKLFQDQNLEYRSGETNDAESFLTASPNAFLIIKSILKLQ